MELVQVKEPHQLAKQGGVCLAPVPVLRSERHNTFARRRCRILVAPFHFLAERSVHQRLAIYAGDRSRPTVCRDRGTAPPCSSFTSDRVPDPAILLQAYLECLNAICHHKQRDSEPGARVQSQIVKMLTTKTKASTAGYREAYELCLDLWDEGLSSVLAGPRGEGADRGERGGDGDLPAACEMALMRGHEVLLRLALLADFYSEDRASDPSATPPRTEDSVEPGAGDGRKRGSPAARPRPHSPEPPGARGLVKWSAFLFRDANKSYYAKLVRAFQTVKAVGHTRLTLNSEWALGCYYRLAAAYTCERVRAPAGDVCLSSRKPRPSLASSSSTNSGV
ncbi:hypothetical protein Q5P01_000596 [Channa striata]|uniref:Uncharacterized protein n=1 Tax=Channa striata TaxID=64152 RepID=A0AA88LF34_CHASR|nr:hypothetical protein Q5P01_000596 [Channa striata]